MASTSTCVYCHQKKLDRGLVARPSSLSPEDETAYIFAETRRIENLIRQLHEDRAALLRRLNAIRSTTNVLVPETLSLIFQHASPRPDYFRENQESEPPEEAPFFHLALGSVSWQWRQVVHSTPNLWNYICVTELEASDAAKWSVPIQRSLKKSGCLPFDIALHLDGEEWEEYWDVNGHLFSPDVDDDLLHNCYRIRSLCIQVPSLRENWLSVLARLTGLVDLSIDCHESHDKLSFPSNLHITRLRLNHACIQELDIVNLTSSLTVLDFCQIPIDICMLSFFSCPGLVEFRCTLPMWPKADSFPPPTSTPVIFANLEVLHWTLEFRPWDMVLLENAHVPMLKSLRWMERDPANYSLVSTFFERLPLTLEIIEFAEIDRWRQHEMIDNIRPETKIKHIGMELCSLTFLADVLHRLCPNGSDAVAYPDLESISMDGSVDANDNLDNDMGQLLARALKQRHPLVGVREFTFSTKYVPPFDWNHNNLELFRYLIREGIPLRILHNNKIILDHVLIEH